MMTPTGAAAQTVPPIDGYSRLDGRQKSHNLKMKLYHLCQNYT